MSKADDYFRRKHTSPAPTGAEQEFLLVAAALGVLLFVAAHALDPRPGWLAEALALGLFVAGMSLALAGVRAGYPHPRMGGCNGVTQGRAALVALLSVPVCVPAVLSGQPHAVFAIAAVALVLDGLDGFLARRAGLVSVFGARFDMEVDAALGAMLALIHLRAGQELTPVPVICLLVLGFIRYAFVGAARLWPWLGGPLPESLLRKTVCVVQIATLCALLLSGTGGPVATVAMSLAAALVLWSFGRDILWLSRQRGTQGA